MLSQLRIKLLFLFIICGFSLAAQTIPSIHLTIQDGLPSNAVYSIFKDSKGFMWIGTDAGLVRYDGYTFKTFTKKDGLCGNFIWDIKEDSSGKLWLACYGDGLSAFDGSTFKNFTPKDGLVHREIRRLYFDKHDNLWIGTERGLSVWNGQRFINFLENSFNKYNRFQVMQFWEESNGLYFLSRTHGYYRAYLKQNSLKCQKLGKLHSQVFFARIAKSKLFAKHDGLFYDISRNQFPVDSLNAHKISSYIVWDMVRTKSGILMAGNGVYRDLGGLLKFHKNKIENISNRFGILSRQLWTFYYDKKEAKIWVSTLDDGIYIINEGLALKKFKLEGFRDILKSNGTTVLLTKEALLIEKKGRKPILIQRSDFIRQVNRQLSYYYTPRPHAPSLLSKKEGNASESGFELRKVQLFNNHIWVSSSNGLVELNLDGDFLKVHNNEVNDFIIYPSEIIFPWPHGNLTKMSYVAKNHWHIVHTQPRSWNDPKDIFEIIQLKNFYILVSSLRGLYVMKEGDSTAKRLHLQGLNDLKLKDACTDGQMRCYVLNSNNEIVSYAFRNGKFIKIEKINTSYLNGESILKITHDGNHLFILTNRGLYIQVGKRYLYRDQEQGFNFKKITCFKVIRDHLIIGTENGYYEWNISNLIHSVGTLTRLTLQQPITSTTEMPTLSYPSDNKNISLYFNRISLYHPLKNKYEYSLDKKNWTVFTGSILKLNQLASGKYPLYIRQTDAYSGKQAVYQLAKIFKAQPFWREFWFILLMLLSLTCLFIILFRWRMRKIQFREQQKAELLKRIAETKLEALQSQMNPHFIFNSLTAIHSFIIKSDVDNALMYMDKFSKLTRQTLEFSSRTQISLLEELEYLSHFIALENMRFGDKVQVHFNVGELDTPKIKIPPLLIQPLVENAFEHGFTDRQRNYNLYLEFKTDSNYLKVSVKDDGKGFEASIPKPESKAMTIIRERLFLIDPELRDFFKLRRKNELTIVEFRLPLAFQ